MHDYMTTIYKRVSSMMSPGLCKMKAIFVFVCLGELTMKIFIFNT